jgi:putative transposase
VILRGNNRNIIFVAEEDYLFFIECLQRAVEEHGCTIHAYVLMTNHVHLLMTPTRENSISKAMQSLGRRYVQYFNYTQKRSGTLWEGRYKATVIDSEQYLLTCYRYIELNPVRAKMVAQPQEYPWSSYLCHAEGAANELIVDHPLYLSLGKDREERQVAYRALFAAHVSEVSMDDIRAATNKGWALGGERFVQEVAKALSRRIAPLARGRKKLV